MPITVGHEPNALLQSLLQFVAGFGEQKRAYEALENQQTGIRRQNQANAIGGAAGKVGGSFFDRKRLEEDRRIADERIDRQNQFRLLLEQNESDLRKYGLPTSDIANIAAEKGVGPYEVRRDIGYQRVMDEMAANGLDQFFEPGLTPKDERKYLELMDSLREINEPGAPLEPFEIERMNENIHAQLSQLRTTMVPRKQPKPVTWDEELQAKTSTVEEIPGGRIYHTRDRNGAWRIEHVKYDTGGKKSDGFSLDEKDWLLLEDQAFEALSEEVDVPAPTKENPGATRTVTKYPDANDPRVEEYIHNALSRRQRILSSFGQGQTGALPESGGPAQFGPGAMGGQPVAKPVYTPREQPGDPTPQATQIMSSIIEMMTDRLGPVRGGDPREWPPEVVAQARGPALIMAEDIERKYRGVPEEEIPMSVRQIAFALKHILGTGNAGP